MLLVGTSIHYKQQSLFFFLVRLAKRARHENDHARDGRHKTKIRRKRETARSLEHQWSSGTHLGSRTTPADRISTHKVYRIKRLKFYWPELVWRQIPRELLLRRASQVSLCRWVSHSLCLNPLLCHLHKAFHRLSAWKATPKKSRALLRSWWNARGSAWWMVD